MPPTKSPTSSTTPSTWLIKWSSLLKRPSVPSPRSRRPVTSSRFFIVCSRFSLAQFTFRLGLTGLARGHHLPDLVGGHPDVLQDFLDLGRAIVGDALDVVQNV